MICLFISLLAIYFITIFWLIYGVNKMLPTKNRATEPKTCFSIIVPFRNEQLHFLDLLNSVASLQYPKNLYEIVVVNDDSNDASAKIFKQWQTNNLSINSMLLSNIRLTNSPKKDAIATAIAKTKNDWIITTDADCIVNKNWLSCYDNFIQNNNCEMIASMVICNNKDNFLDHFQYLDLLSLQGTTIGSFGINKPFMCNGANFAYTQTLFATLDGFNGNYSYASGDDVFLLQKALKQCPTKVRYLKNLDAIVVTQPEPSWSQLFQQRVRWASKTKGYDGLFAKYLAVVVLIMNFSLIMGIFVLPIVLIILIFLIKFATDCVLLNQTNKIIKPRTLLVPILAGLIYPIFCVLVAFYSFVGTFEWKNRTFNQ